MGVLGAVLLLAAGQGQAVEAAPATPSVDTKLVCRRGEETGSRVRAKRVCRTRAEWEQMDSAAQRGFDGARARSRPTG